MAGHLPIEQIRPQTTMGFVTTRNRAERHSRRRRARPVKDRLQSCPALFDDAMAVFRHRADLEIYRSVADADRSLGRPNTLRQPLLRLARWRCMQATILSRSGISDEHSRNTSPVQSLR
jgi:hypothetical protein